MRRFNPEKELRKIQHGNRNRIIAFAFLLLVVSVISYSFALYQVRYSKRIIYTKVAPFSSNKDIELAVNIKNEGPRDTFPKKEDGYVYMGTECDKPNVTEVEWKETLWKLNLLTSGPNKCTVTFGSTYTVDVEVESHGTVAPSTQEVTPKGTSGTFIVIPEEGYEVDIVTCSNNQIVEQTKNTFIVTNVTSDTKCTVTMGKTRPLFNYCMENEQLSTCLPKALEDMAVIEDNTPHKNIRYVGHDPNNYIWFNCDSYSGTMDETNCEKWRIIGYMNDKSRVKIIRADSVGSMQWNSTSNNNWTRPATLQTSLTKYYNGTAITPTYGAGAKGITSSTKNMIAYVTWNLGTSGRIGSILGWYNNERGSTGAGAAPTKTTWDGYVALIYPSDYGYAAHPSCWSTSMGSYSKCKNVNWLYTGYSQWTLTPLSEETYGKQAIATISQDGDAPGYVTNRWVTTDYQSVRPSLYLSPSVKIKSGVGNGTAESPYVLIPY